MRGDFCNGDFHTDTGFCTFTGDRDISRTEVDQIIQYTIDETIKAVGGEDKIHKGFSDTPELNLYFLDEVPDPEDDTHVNGLAEAEVTQCCGWPIHYVNVYVAYYPSVHDDCLAGSALSHEIIHVLSFFIEGGEWAYEQSRQHVEPYFYELDTKIKRGLREKYCQD
jgi:hypothetical protein